jgi:sugar lactone lactonase YvrE
MKNHIYLFICLCVFLSCKNEVKQDTLPDVRDVISATPSLTPLWSTDTTLLTPESVIFDEKYGVYYVTCIGGLPPDAKDGDGYIARVDQQGVVQTPKWITGLNAPKGMALRNDTLYVADISDLVIIDVANNKIVKKIPIGGAQFLNDVDVTADGRIIFTDSNTNHIHMYDGKSSKVFFNSDTLGGPNGVYVDGDQLVMASFGSGKVYTLSLNNPVVEFKTDSIAGGDGVEKYSDGYFVSNWNGEVYFVDKDWKKTLLLDTKAEGRNAADIELVKKDNVLLVPEFFKNKVTAYKIN